MLGVTHAEIGAYLLGIWGLPYSIVEAVAHHHTPRRVGLGGLDVLDGRARRRRAGRGACPSTATGTWARASASTWASIERLGLQDQLPAWRQIAAEEAQKSVRSACRAQASASPRGRRTQKVVPLSASVS